MSRAGYAAADRRTPFDEVDIANIRTLLRESTHPYNVSHLAREMSRRWPRHSYASYQTYLQKNMYGNLNLYRLGNTAEGVPLRKRVMTYAGAAPPASAELDATTPAGNEAEEDELEDLEQEAPAPPAAEAESDEEIFDEDEILRFEQEQRRTSSLAERVAPRSLYERRCAHAPFADDEKEGLCEMLAVLIDNPDKASDNELLASAAGAPGPEFWEAVADSFPQHSSAAWRAHFESHRLELLRAAHGVARAGLPARTDSRRSSVSNTPEPEADAPEPDADAPAPSFVSDEPLATQGMTPSRTQSTRQLSRTPTGDMSQRLEHHNAKAAARAEQSLDDVESPTEQLPWHAEVDSPRSRTVPTFRRRASVHRDAMSSPLAEGEDLPMPWADARASRLARARADYEADVWQLCDRYGFSAPAQLLPFMRQASGDVEICATHIERYLARLAGHYGVTSARIREMLRVQEGDLNQLCRTMDVFGAARGVH